MASSIFHEDNMRAISINIVEEKIFHLSLLFFHDSSIDSTSVRKSDPLDVLEEGSKLGDVAHNMEYTYNHLELISAIVVWS